MRVKILKMFNLEHVLDMESVGVDVLPEFREYEGTINPIYLRNHVKHCYVKTLEVNPEFHKGLSELKIIFVVEIMSCPTHENPALLLRYDPRVWEFINSININCLR